MQTSPLQAVHRVGPADSLRPTQPRAAAEAYASGYC